MNTTLGKVKAGDEILSITNNKGVTIPADKVTTGIPFTAQPEGQRLNVTSVWTNGKTILIRFANGGRLLPVDVTTPCMIA